LTQEQKQLIAREFNFSETIFVHPRTGQNSSSGDNKQRIDIFTVTDELPFAGHPTIGAASWLLRHAPTPSSSSAAAAGRVNTIITKAGDIPISTLPIPSPTTTGKEESGPVAAIVPHDVRIHANRYSFSELLAKHPDLKPYLSNNSNEEAGFPIFSIVKGMTQIHVPLPNLDALAAVKPARKGKWRDQTSYLDDDADWGGAGTVVTYFHVRNVVDDDDPIASRTATTTTTEPAGQDQNTPKKVKREVIRTRMTFHSAEDPATGSAACGLACYLALTEGPASGVERFNFDVIQGVEMGRRSDIGVKVVVKPGAKEIDTVELSGSAVKITEGEILV
jgi:predicted PhzF superfamily epimerase YddE/YHI9